MSEPSVAELRALSEHAAGRVALYRRRVYLGQGDPQHLAELERIAQGAAARLRRAEDAARTSGGPGPSTPPR